MMSSLLLLGFQGISGDLLFQVVKDLSTRLQARFTNIDVHPILLTVPHGAFDPSRRQYLANPFLVALKDYTRTDVCGLALVNLDLFVPELNFIFGIAQPGGNALVAVPRLNPTFYDLPPNPVLYQERILKEALHELGHVFGLGHCSNNCVMQFSNSLLDTDRKPTSFCSSCMHKAGLTEE